MDTRQTVRALKTPVTLIALLALVVLSANWAWDAVRAPIPRRPHPPCVVKDIGPELKPENVYVEVYNGSETNGLAKRLGQLLSADGFKVLRRVNADRNDYPESLVVGKSEDSPEVILVRQAFDNIAFQADGRTDATVDVIIGANQPVPLENPSFGVPLPDGKACVPEINVAANVD
ncbi:MAG: LytR C-terminal domain-containing protein [Propioniciclava sp.]|uniref:LytR C-terminal domain-containing protein n=1 Tax=Propioniciclava sp. TaxID=2038686 RepID=UPI0039E2A24A